MSYDPVAADALLAAIGPRPDWQRWAACRGADAELFFPPRRGSAVAAKAICARCPVAAECADYALAFPPERLAGVWGGLAMGDRQEIRSQRRGGGRGRAA